MYQQGNTVYCVSEMILPKSLGKARDNKGDKNKITKIKFSLIKIMLRITARHIWQGY
jgi:hypothetical protein